MGGCGVNGDEMGDDDIFGRGSDGRSRGGGGGGDNGGSSVGRGGWITENAAAVVGSNNDIRSATFSRDESSESSTSCEATAAIISLSSISGYYSLHSS